MTNETTTLASFVDSNLKPVRASRAYLLNKPCARCHRSTNLRVHLPTCSHRICSTCLAELEVLHHIAGPVTCPTCATYWFTLQPTCEESNAGRVDHALPRTIEGKSHVIERLVYKGQQQPEDDAERGHMLEQLPPSPEEVIHDGNNISPTTENFPSTNGTPTRRMSLEMELTPEGFVQIKERWEASNTRPEKVQNAPLIQDEPARPQPLSMAKETSNIKDAGVEINENEKAAGQTKSPCASATSLHDHKETPSTALPEQKSKQDAGAALGGGVPSQATGAVPDRIKSAIWPAALLVIVFVAFTMAAWRPTWPYRLF